MKRSRFTEEQIIAVLREQEAGAKTADVCRKHGISDATAGIFRPSSTRAGARQPSGLGCWRPFTTPERAEGEIASSRYILSRSSRRSKSS